MRKTQEKHNLPAIFSFFFPGLGQIVKGEFGKGIVIFLGMIINVILIMLLIGLVTTPILWAWNIYDAYS